MRPVPRPLPFLQGLFRFWNAHRLQRQYAQRLLPPYLKAAATELGSYDHYRIYDYASRGMLLGGESFALLRPEPLTSAERRRLTFFGALTPLVDDAFDRVEGHERILELMLKPEQFQPQSQREAVLKELQAEAIEDRKTATTGALMRAFKAQQGSLKQQKLLSQAELLALTREKGASGTCCYVVLLEQTTTGTERVAEEAGFLIQLMDDLFDAPKDREEGIYTPMTEARSAEAQELLVHQLKQVEEAVANTDTSPSQRSQFMTRLQVLMVPCLMLLRKGQRLEQELDMQHLGDLPRARYQLSITKVSTLSDAAQVLLR